MSDTTDKKVEYRSIWLVLTMIVSILLAFYTAFWLPEAPENETEYESLSQLVTEQKSQGYVQLGRFGNGWPARLVETIEGEGSVNFVRKDGTPHTYQKFDGYRLRVLRLEARGGEEVILVLRSVTKVGAPATAAPGSVVTEDEWERETRLLREEREREGSD